MSSEGSRSHIRWCSQCATNFTQTNWRLHAHNPDQALCQERYCRRKAVGHMLGYAPQLLCGAHLMEARRNGHEVTLVDGRVCGVCEGDGQVHAQEVRTDSPGGAWLRCPECLGTGYDPILKLPSSSQGNEGRERTRRQRPSSQESPSERRIREAEQRDARNQWFEREIAPLANGLPARGTSGPDLALGSRREDIRTFEREARRLYGGKKRKERLNFLLLAGAATLAGAVVGVLFIYPLLPDAAAGVVADMQQQISNMFTR